MSAHRSPLEAEASRLRDRWLRGLQGLVGEGRLLRDPPELEWAGRDALTRYRSFGRLQRLACLPVAVVVPESAGDVAAVVEWASRERVPLVPRGAGTGVMGGAVPLRPAVVLDLSRIDHVAVDADAMAATAGAGAPLAAVAEAAARHGLMFAHDPWSQAMATVGGAISTNGMGYLYGRYGTMADQVLAVEAVLADGTRWRSRFSPAGVAGPQLMRLLSGAQGTFAVITEAVLRLWPAPEVRAFRAFRFQSFEAGFRAVRALFGAGLAPAVLDLSDSGPERVEESLREPEAAGGPPAPGANRGREISTLILGFFGFQEEVDAQVARAGRLCREHEGEEVGSELALRYWEKRHAVAERWRQQVWRVRDLRALDSDERCFDYLNVALPAGKVLEYRRQALELASRVPDVVVETGLWGRPEIFSLLLWDQAHRLPGARRGPAGEGEHPLDRLVDDLLRLCHRFGGTMEAIHGTGLRLRHLLADEWGPGLELLHRIKAAVDPAGILNPGKWGDLPGDGAPAQAGAGAGGAGARE